MSVPHKSFADFKPESGHHRRSVRRTPWFVAGVGIPLLGLAIIMAPDRSPDDPAPDLAEPQSLVADTAPGISSPATGSEDVSVEAATLTTEATDTTAQALAAPGTSLTLEVGRGDSLDRLFGRHDLSRADLAGIMKLDLARKHLRLIRPGDKISVQHQGPELLQLSRDVSLTEWLLVTRTEEGGFTAEIMTRELERRPVTAGGAIKSSLFLAAADAGVSDRTIMNLAGIFAWDVDFVLDIRAGDQFNILYEELWLEGEAVGEGNILAAEFINQGRTYRAIRFTDDTGRVDYYSPEGRSMRKAFLRAPLEFSRISSNFNPNRRHPKLNVIRAHKGVDYAAPTGTPIKAAGDGKIIFRGVKGGYGNTIILQHGGNITTLYGHMSRFAKSRNGSRVRQGEVIGYVGSSGLATGPHLHYEYRLNGTHMNPRTVKLPDAAPIDKAQLANFRQVTEVLLQQLDSQRNMIAGDIGNPTS